MAAWSPQTWISLISATVSVIGAGVTLYWTRRRMIWDAGRELGELRSDTLLLIYIAKLLDHKMWSVGAAQFHSFRMNWEHKVRSKEPLFGPKARITMKDLGLAFICAEHEVFGTVRVFTGDEREDARVESACPLGHQTRLRFEKAEQRLADPHFLTK